MNIALRTDTNTEIEAEELRYIDKDKMPSFVCVDENCATPLVPAAYTLESKQRPHFRTSKYQKHTEKCKFSDYAKILELGGSRKLRLEEFENMPIPRKLVLPKVISESDQIKSKEKNSDAENTTATKRAYSNEFDEKGNTFRNVTTISRIADFYIACPFNRDLPLDIFGLEQPYMFWFKRLRNITPEENPGLKIFFGQLHQDQNAIQENDDFLTIKLFDCERWDEFHTQINPYYVQIAKKNLSINKVSRIKNEISYSLREQKEFYESQKIDKQKSNSSKVKPYVFFYGKMSANNRFIFEVYDGYLVSRYCQVKPTV